MSTSFYLACHDCKTVLNIANTGLSGFSFYSGEPDCMRALRNFVDKHTFERGHRLEIVSEDSPADVEYVHIEWKSAKSKQRMIR